MLNWINDQIEWESTKAQIDQFKKKGFLLWISVVQSFLSVARFSESLALTTPLMFTSLSHNDTRFMQWNSNNKWLPHNNNNNVACHFLCVEAKKAKRKWPYTCYKLTTTTLLKATVSFAVQCKILLCCAQLFDVYVCKHSINQYWSVSDIIGRYE